MLNANVLRYGVSAPGTAAQCKRRSQLKVVQIADTAVGGRCIYKNTAGLHSFCMLHHLFFFIYIDVQRRGMAVAAVCYQTLCLIQSLVKGLSLVHSQYTRQLFVSKLLADIYRLNLADDNLCINRNIHTCQLCDGVCRLSYDLCI